MSLKITFFYILTDIYLQHFYHYQWSMKENGFSFKELDLNEFSSNRGMPISEELAEEPYYLEKLQLLKTKDFFSCINYFSQVQVLISIFFEFISTTDTFLFFRNI